MQLLYHQLQHQHQMKELHRQRQQQMEELHYQHEQQMEELHRQRQHQMEEEETMVMKTPYIHDAFTDQEDDVSPVFDDGDDVNGGADP